MYFSDAEFKEPRKLSPTLRRMLERVREEAGVPMRITGSWRSRRGPIRKSAHQTNKFDLYEAVDVGVGRSRNRFLILKAAIRVGFNRIGVYDKHLHLDIAKGTAFDQDVCWWGRSK